MSDKVKAFPGEVRFPEHGELEKRMDKFVNELMDDYAIAPFVLLGLLEWTKIKIYNDHVGIYKSGAKRT